MKIIISNHSPEYIKTIGSEDNHTSMQIFHTDNDVTKLETDHEFSWSIVRENDKLYDVIYEENGEWSLVETSREQAAFTLLQ